MRTLLGLEKEPGPDLLRDFPCSGAPVGWQVIKDADVAWAKCRCENAFDEELEYVLIHRATDDPCRVDPLMAQASNEGLCIPMKHDSRQLSPNSDIPAHADALKDDKRLIEPPELTTLAARGRPLVKCRLSCLVKHFKTSPAMIREGLVKPALAGMMQVWHDVVKFNVPTSETRI